MASDNETLQADVISTVKSGLTAFSMAAKNYALYPETNPICHNSLLKFKEWLDSFLLQQDNLRLTVEKDSFSFQQEIVLQDKPGEQVLVYPFFRDGIQWFEFLQDVTTEELHSFITLLNRFRILKEEAEDDLVTAMWEANFPHIHYKTANEFWEIEPLVDIATINPGPEIPQGRSSDSAESSPHFGKFVFMSQDANESPAIKKQKKTFWELKQSERALLKGMISEEEQRNTTRDCLDVLFILLTTQSNEASSASALNFLLDEIQYALSQGDFSYVHQFLVRLNHLLKFPDSSKPWLTPFLLSFQKKIASYDVLDEALNNTWSRINTLTEDAMEELRQILLLMPSEVINALVHTLGQTENTRIQNMLIEIIAIQVCRAPAADMSGAISRIKSPLLRQLINTLKSQELPYPPSLLVKLAGHGSDLVQEEAIKALLHRDPRYIMDLFHHIYKAPPNVKRLICHHLSQRMDHQAEELLLNYLRDSQKQGRELEREHIADCYRALAQGASQQTLQYFQETLLKRGWRSYLGIDNQSHRMGAALALMLMPQSEEVKKILETALTNAHLSISSAYWQAKEEISKIEKGRKS